MNFFRPFFALVYLLAACKLVASDAMQLDIGQGLFITLPLYELSDEDNNRLSNPDISSFRPHINESLRAVNSIKNSMT